MKLILASNSPRRKEILTDFGYKFNVEAGSFEENNADKNPIVTAVRFAKGKALRVFSQIKNENSSEDALVIGADTVVYFENKIIGKPIDFSDAFNMLKALSGKKHKVITGFALLSRKVQVFGYDCSEVMFNELSDNSIEKYISMYKPFDKAGSYGIQDGFDLVRAVSGSKYNVIGLPIEKIKPVLDFFIK